MKFEVYSGLILTLVSVSIIGGSIAISFVEKKQEISQSKYDQNLPTLTNSAAMIITPPGSGDPTKTPTNIPVMMLPTSATATPSCEYPTEWIAITSEEGDSIDSIADAFLMSPETLMKSNCLISNSLSPGSTIYVPEKVPTLSPTMTPTVQPTEFICPSPPVGWVLYTVQNGDTLFSLGSGFGLTVVELQTANCMGSSTLIQAGEVIWVPFLPTTTFTPTSSPKPEKTIEPSSTPRFRRTRRPTRTPRFSN